MKSAHERVALSKGGYAGVDALLIDAFNIESVFGCHLLKFSDVQRFHD